MTDSPTEVPDSYVSVEAGPEVEIKVKASRFLGRVLPARSAEDAARAVAEARSRHHDARHHGWAFRLGPPERPRSASSDDGEPSGTTGPPILSALERAQLHDAVCVVTRWFGGTKLGTGGLVRAYGEAARLAEEAAPRRVVHREARVLVRCGYDDLGAVEAELSRSGAEVRGAERRFEPTPVLEIRTLRSRAAGLAARITEATAGRAELRVEVEEPAP